jgi:hypothetical protein
MVNGWPTIYLDGAAKTPGGRGGSIFLAYQDAGTNASLLWSRANGKPVKISGSLDLGGTCIWVTGLNSSIVNCLDLATGAVDNSFDLATLGISSQTLTPMAALSEATACDGHHLIIMGVQHVPGTGYVISVDVSTKPPSLAWKIQLKTGEDSFSQYPIANTDQGPLVAAITGISGIYMIGN